MTDRALRQGDGGAIAPPNPWDPVVRVTHWAVVVAVIANQFILKEGGTWHIWVGWGLMAVLGLRLIWGLVGPRPARFSAFPPNPGAALRHLGRLIRRKPMAEHASHNPAGAMMAYALWACLAVVIATGLVMTGGKSPISIAEEKAAVAAGDWSVLVRDSHDEKADETPLGEAAEEVHEVAANLILLLAVLHVLGVVIESRALGRNLVQPMIKRVKPNP